MVTDTECKYLSEDVLIEKFQSGEIDYHGLLTRHSPERTQEYLEFCRENELEPSNDAAMAFIENEIDTFDAAMAAGEI